LAKAVAIQCVVHNCTAAMNSGSMAKFFKGLVSTGAWSCFDEFNRIKLEVLSVIAQQIHEIQTAKSQHLKEFKFHGTPLKMKPVLQHFHYYEPGLCRKS
jgi:dynein heavy chain